MKVRDLLSLAKAAAKGWKADNCLSMGAALAFYSLLSMAPLLVLVITVAGLVIGRDEAQALLFTQLSACSAIPAPRREDRPRRRVLEGRRPHPDAGERLRSAGRRHHRLRRIAGRPRPHLEVRDAQGQGTLGQVRKRLLSFG
jgi:hypothetical protein